jgi:NAD(P)-dependent dehydrogenase (short-subunit alcohol dehydrogenase family)
MTPRFHDSLTLVTGGASGLGAAVAARIAEAGGKVVVLDVDERDGEATARRVGGRFWRVDVSDPSAWPVVVGEIEDAMGPIHYAHLNAGVMSAPRGQAIAAARLENISVERYRAVVGVNLDGVFFGLQTLLPKMTTRGGGCVTVTASAAGLVPIAFDPLYAATKHALVGLVRSLALAFADGPARLNALCPGGIDTPMLPAEFRRHDGVIMTAAEMSEEIVGLLLDGAMGEIRVKLRRDQPARAVRPPDVALG